ncbi:hypothetical protein C922_04680 [Plasmodium inui San Antonio 1]|uniref:Plasmodium RESA N-terminal domain-containing protein n=1 Tax=Plasmodium inui San Antonio 1 TaxID=1237626 RepID=W7A086_9APIC|nr:hypothetical protein C922_04680 [Plasmodium inui San Antonio 1]EUD64948.1 hypothetical protein C922_04680 [Plasmodium inui San Antonio 1]
MDWMREHGSVSSLRSDAANSVRSRTHVSEVVMESDVLGETSRGEESFIMATQEMSAIFASVHMEERKKSVQIQENLKNYCTELANDCRVRAHYVQKQCSEVQREATASSVRKEKSYLRNLRKLTKKG